MNRKKLWGAFAAVLVATVAAYVPSIEGEFQYDDQEIAKTTWVRDASRFLEPGFWLTVARPLTAATFAVNHEIDAFRPRVWHVTNVLVHLFAVVLAWRFARRMLARSGIAAGGAGATEPAAPVEPERGKGKGRGKAQRALAAAVRAVPEWPALAVTAIFALHPLSTEAVSYISQRSEALASAIVLAGLLVLFRWDEASEQRRIPLALAAIALHFVGLTAKPIAAPMPALWLLAAVVLPVPAERDLAWWQRLTRRLPRTSSLEDFLLDLVRRPAVAMFALSIGAALTNVKEVAGSGHAGFDLSFVTPLEYVATQMRALPIYVRLVLAPYGLSADWYFPYSRSFLEPAVLGGMAFVAALVAAAFVLVARFGREEGDVPAAARLAAFGWLFFLGMLTPTTFVPLRDPFVEHRLYLPTLGIVLAVTGAVLVGIRRLGPARGRIVAIVAAVAVAGGLGAATAVRNQVWQSALALWSDASEKSPQKPRIWVNYGTALHFAGRYEEAVRAYDRALALGFDPTVPVELVVRNTALALVRLRRYDDARARLVNYLRKAPQDAATIVILALVEVDTNRLDAAELAARQALTIDPRQSRPYQILGQVQEKRGDLQGAFDHFATAARVDPADPLPVYSMGRIEERRGRVTEACNFYARATDALARSSAARGAAEAYARLCQHHGPLP